VSADIIRIEDATPAPCVSATDAILNHGWRKVTQSLANGGEDALKLIHRNERGIVCFDKRGFQNVARISKR